MRMRFKPYARPELLACPYHVHEPLAEKGRWLAGYTRPQQPFHIELGCGKGGFLSQLALRHPEINYLGIDITDKVLILAKRKIERAYLAAGQPVDNVKITDLDIERIYNALDGNDKAERIYINFCNPWDRKKKSEKHRLTYPRQLLHYRTFLAENGEIYFKTDNDALFEDSLDYFAIAGFEVVWMTRDLHADEPAWNIRTEHEEMFTAEGIPTKALIARRLPDSAVRYAQPPRKKDAGMAEETKT